MNDDDQDYNYDNFNYEGDGDDDIPDEIIDDFVMPEEEEGDEEDIDNYDDIQVDEEDPDLA